MAGLDKGPGLAEKTPPSHRGNRPGMAVADGTSGCGPYPKRAPRRLPWSFTAAQQDTEPHSTQGAALGAKEVPETDREVFPSAKIADREPNPGSSAPPADS